MVLKNFVRYLINKFLKDYIEELDYERLKLDLKQGKLIEAGRGETCSSTSRSCVLGMLASQTRSFGA